jgi:hypothetical protein
MADEHQTSWDRMPSRPRKALVWALWLITWLGLVAGMFNRAFFEWVVLFSALHAVFVWSLHNGRIMPFPVQVRMAYFVAVAIGTYVPYMVFFMYIALVGLATNLFLGYCPLARLMYLMPWNRDEPLSLELASRVALSPPRPGPFKPVSRAT